MGVDLHHTGVGSGRGDLLLRHSSDSSGPVKRIVDVEDGSTVTIAGIVRLSEGVLVSPLGQKRCAYYGVHKNLLDVPHAEPPEEHDARDFIVEDASGRALVVMRDYEVSVATERRKQAVTSLDTDIRELSGRLRELKDQLRDNPGPRQAMIRAELERGRHLATLLCAVRAHARGKLHMHKSFRAQEHYIMTAQSEAAGDRRLFMLQRYEACLEEGQRVWVHGLATWEPDPSRPLGYRDQARALVMRAPPAARLMVRTARMLNLLVEPQMEPRLEPRGLRSVFTFIGAVVLTIMLFGLARYCG